MIKIIRSIDAWRTLRNTADFAQGSIGFVPTMGALHEGHCSLLRRARQENEIVVLSLFVNPTQFDDPNDLAKYPNTLESDLAIAEQEKVNYVFMPPAEEIYAEGYRYRVEELELSKQFCGEFRPGHFNGVLTVVMKLFQLVKPNFAYFGEKDFQQLQLIKGMVDAFFLDVVIVPCPTVRDADTLALSSRNLRLNPSERKIAVQFAQGLSQNFALPELKDYLEKLGIQVDYIADYKDRRLAAVRVGNIRLIDNRSHQELV